MHSEFEIEAIHARQILDSRGNPTLECEVQLAGGAVGDALHGEGSALRRAEAR